MRLLKIAGRMLAFFAIALVLLLLSCQSRLMYFPRPYGKASLWDLEQRKGRELAFTTSQGRQVAFYLPPRADPAAEPVFLWIVCGGNGSLALDYSEEPMHWDGRFGYLFVDYPGYGLCAGSPNPKRIEENVVKAAAALREELGWNDEEFRARAGVFGHSIGCAAALMAADDLQLKSAVLCAPFTTMTEMGRCVLGWPLCYLNLHRFDNVSRLRSLDQRGASVRIFHGAEDEVIPVEMSHRMQTMFPRMVQFTEVPEGRHNDVVMRAREEVGKAMQALSGMR
jgi:pimeloyl-ACP methyl ester carboxylesterase